MLVNRDRDHDHAVKVDLQMRKRRGTTSFPVSSPRLLWGKWHPGGGIGEADPDGPPIRSTVNGGADTLYELPKASVTVLRGNLSARDVN
jgi:hypothetical protein